jgi:uncharacterized protein (TIGR02757 family)
MGCSDRSMGLKKSELKEFLDEKVELYNRPSFIESDPISIPHQFTEKQDIEIAGFLAATIAWGRRDLILRSCRMMMTLMDNEPYDFVMQADDDQIQRLSSFVHRTFNGTDMISFINSLRYIFSRYKSLEDVIAGGITNGSLKDGLSHLRTVFFMVPHAQRSEKHLADVSGCAAGKRLNMFLRWMVRNDRRGVDFGIWNKIKPSQLYIPLDFHSGNTARKLGILTRNINDWKAVEELTEVLRCFDPEDPVKYDFALFGLGVNEKF